MLQAVSHLRRNGFFVCVALTRPFSFEGPRKLEQADALIEAMEDVASLVVTIDQNVLVRARSGLRGLIILNKILNVAWSSPCLYPLP